MKKMTEEKKEQLRARMREYWKDVRAGKIVHRTRWDTYKDRREAEAQKQEAAPEPPPEPTPTPTKPETGISPMAKAEHIHFPMPGVKSEIKFMINDQQPAEQKPKTNPVGDNPHPRPNLNPPILVGDKKTVQQLKQAESNYTKPKVVVALGRKVQVNFKPQQPKSPQKVIMQFGRRARNPGDL